MDIQPTLTDVPTDSFNWFDQIIDNAGLVTSFWKVMPRWAFSSLGVLFYFIWFTDQTNRDQEGDKIIRV